MNNKSKEIVKKTILQTPQDLEGKPSMSKEDFEAGLKFAKDKVRPVNRYFSNPDNVKDFQTKLARLNS